MDLRQWIREIKNKGELTEIRGAAADIEIGSLAALVQSKMESMALLFSEIPGYLPGYSILTNTLTSMKRLAYTLGLKDDLVGVSLIKAIKDQFSQLRPIAEHWVNDGPIKENVYEGASVDLLSMPIPKLHEHDGGRYLGTGSVVIMRDPDTGWVNVGTYRVMLSDARTCTMHIVGGRHGEFIRNKYWQLNKPCPVVVATGGDLLLYLLSGMEMPWGQNEMQLVGGWRKEPLAVVTGPVTGLPVPADAEIAVEGFLPPNTMLPEGPFGEWRGYYSQPGGIKPVMEVVSLMHRNDPVLVASVPCLPPSDTTYPRGFLRSALVWHQLDQAGLPGVSGCWIVPCGGDRPFLVVSLEQLYPGHSIQVGMMAATCPAFNYGGVVTIVVDQDVDISKPEQLIWALSTRFNPEKDIHVIPKTWGNPVFKTAEQTPGLSSRVVFDATIPWENKDRLPQKVQVSDEWINRLKNKWPELFIK